METTNQPTVERTTYRVDGIDEPCIIVSDGYTKVRISKCYHYIGRDTCYVTEYLDGDFNGEEEMNGDFDTLTDREAVKLAKSMSAYLRA